MAANDPMRFLCFGLGAIGTYIGGSLALSGQRVVFMERPEVAAEVRQRGLRLTAQGVERQVERPEIVDALEAALALGPYDAAILAVKSFDTPAVLQPATSCRAQMPPVICLQNGVENEALIAEALGPEKVVSGTITTAVGRKAAGDVFVEKLRGVGLAVDHPLGARLVPAFEAAGLRARAYPNAASLKWSKMLTNLLANASSAILNLTPLQIFEHPGLYRVEVRMLKEALAVMAAQKIAVTDLPATPVRLLMSVIQSLPAGLSRPLVARSVGKGRGAKMPSFHIDLYAGRGRSEVDYLNGAVVRFGERVGVRAPVNAWLTETLLAMTEGRIPKDAYTSRPEAYLAGIEAKIRG
jgi:2-dehydropantoate 2-reductase